MEGRTGLKHSSDRVTPGGVWALTSVKGLASLPPLAKALTSKKYSLGFPSTTQAMHRVSSSAPSARWVGAEGVETRALWPKSDDSFIRACLSTSSRVSMCETSRLAKPSGRPGKRDECRRNLTNMTRVVAHLQRSFRTLMTLQASAWAASFRPRGLHPRRP